MLWSIWVKLQIIQHYYFYMPAAKFCEYVHFMCSFQPMRVNWAIDAGGIKKDTRG